MHSTRWLQGKIKKEIQEGLGVPHCVGPGIDEARGQPPSLEELWRAKEVRDRLSRDLRQRYSPFCLYGFQRIGQDGEHELVFLPSRSLLALDDSFE